MTGAPSGDTSFVHDGPSKPPREWGDDADERHAKSGVSATLRFLLRVAIAIVTVIVCSSATSHGPASASVLASAFHFAATATANAECTASQAEPSQHWQDGAPSCCESDLEAVESDADDDDHLRQLPSLAALFVGCVLAPPNAHVGIWGGELPVDTSRFVAGPGLPRGPPV